MGQNSLSISNAIACDLAGASVNEKGHVQTLLLLQQPWPLQHSVCKHADRMLVLSGWEKEPAA